MELRCTRGGEEYDHLHILKKEQRQNEHL
jgi:hypothetical protein